MYHINGMKNLVLFLYTVVLFVLGGGIMAANEELLLDDFTEEGIPRQAFTDRVMGGRSNMNAFISENGEGNRVLVMRGQVSLENNGGFIQVRLPVSRSGGTFDASVFTGIAMTVKSYAADDENPAYAVHIRTRRTLFPWSYYVQEFSPSREWTRLELPFSDFIGENMLSKTLDPSDIVSLAVVAGEKAGRAEVFVDSISLYK